MHSEIAVLPSYKFINLSPTEIMSLVSGINAIDALIYNSWQPQAARTPVTLSYSFLTQVPAGAPAEDGRGFQPMSAAQQQASRDAMAKWATVANIQFVEVASGGRIQLGTNDQSSSNSSGYAYLPEPGIDTLSLYLSNAESYNSVFTVGSYGPTVLLHELGHTLGLKHPGDYNSTGGSIGGPYLPDSTDNTGYTLMSYHQGSAPRNTYSVGPMLYDIQAIQYLYGANTSYRTGNDTYAFSSSQAPLCVWDAGGVNTFDFSACTGITLIDLNAGAFSGTAAGLTNISIAYDVTIQRAIAGAGGSTIYGNHAGNIISGGSGTDVIHVGDGNDQISGGLGSDTAVFSRSYASYTLSKTAAGLSVAGAGQDMLTGIEYLRFSDRTVTVSELALQAPVVSGTSGNDVLTAGAGNEMIEAGAGLDTVVYGGARGNFQVLSDSGGFRVTDLAGSGGQDVLNGVERLAFGDGALALDAAGMSGQAYRMYRAALDREPDAVGLGYWIKVLDGGAALVQVGQAFIDSPEFSANYGALDNSQFVVQLYANVLDRTPDQPGLAFHVGNLNAGAARAEILRAFSESEENQVAVIGSISNGIGYTPYLG